MGRSGDGSPDSGPIPATGPASHGAGPGRPERSTAATIAGEAFRATVAGLRRVGLQVEPLNADAERDGLLADDLRVLVGAALRPAGIEVVDASRLFAEVRGTPFLHLDVMTIHLDGRYAYSVRLELWQAVRLERDPTVATLGATWCSGQIIGTVEAERLAEVTDAVRAALAEFARDSAPAAPGG